MDIFALYTKIVGDIAIIHTLRNITSVVNRLTVIG
jgi:hypothetical protein